MLLILTFLLPITENNIKASLAQIEITFRTLIPVFFSPLACLFLKSVTVAIGFNPAFSAKVKGITSMASAKDLKQYCSIPEY